MLSLCISCSTSSYEDIHISPVSSQQQYLAIIPIIHIKAINGYISTARKKHFQGDITHPTLMQFQWYWHKVTDRLVDNIEYGYVAMILWS